MRTVSRFFDPGGEPSSPMIREPVVELMTATVFRTRHMAAARELCLDQVDLVADHGFDARRRVQFRIPRALDFEATSACLNSFGGRASRTGGA